MFRWAFTLLILLTGIAIPASAQMVPRHQVGKEIMIPPTGAPSGLPAFSKRQYVLTGQGYDPAQIPTYRLSSLPGAGYSGASFSFPPLPVVGSYIRPSLAYMGRHMGWNEAHTRWNDPQNADVPYYLSPGDDNQELADQCLKDEEINNYGLECRVGMISYGDEAIVERCSLDDRWGGTMSAAPVMILDVDHSFKHPVEFEVSSSGLQDGLVKELVTGYFLAVQAPDASWKCFPGDTRFMSLQQGRYKIHLMIAGRSRQMGLAWSGERDVYREYGDWDPRRKSLELPGFTISFKPLMDLFPVTDIADWAELPPRDGVIMMDGEPSKDAKYIDVETVAGPRQNIDEDKFALTCTTKYGPRTYIFTRKPNLKLWVEGIGRYQNLYLDLEWLRGNEIPNQDLWYFLTNKIALSRWRGPPKDLSDRTMLAAFSLSSGLIYYDGRRTFLSSGLKSPYFREDKCQEFYTSSHKNNTTATDGNYSVWVGIRRDIWEDTGLNEEAGFRTDEVVKVRARLVPRETTN